VSSSSSCSLASRRFQKPNEKDWCFNKLQHNKHHLFWQAHSRNAYFSDSTKHFINKILCVDPTKRLTIEGIKKHPWFNGPTISNSALQTELTRRKATVDEQKYREKLEKKRKLDQDLQNNRQVETGTDRDRGDEPVLGLDGIPIAAPTMDSGAAAPAVTTLELNNSDTSLQLSLSLETKGEEKKLAAAPKWTNTTDCYTRFESDKTPSVVLARLQAVFKGMNVQYSLDEGSYKMKARMLTNLWGNVHFTAQVFADADSKSGVATIVEFRRRQGDSIPFINLYEDVRAQVSDVVRPLKSVQKQDEQKSSATATKSTATSATSASSAQTNITTNKQA